MTVQPRSILEWNFCPVLFQQCVDPVRRIQNGSDRDVVVEGINDQSDKFAHISYDKIRPGQCFRRKIGQVRSDDPVDITGLRNSRQTCQIRL